jgi:rSAM/selenodomain-associated transferase 1
MSMHLIVMAKAPVAGFAKTRLVPPLTHEQAASLAEAMLCDMLARPWLGFERHLCVSGESHHFEAAVRDGWKLSKQADGDLGARLEAASLAAFAAAARAVVFLGTDAPDLPDAFMEELKQALADGAELVVGPATDGGYYTLATSAHVPLLFRGMPWSRPELFDATVAAASAAGLRTHVLPTWSDIDEVEDLARFDLRFSESVLAGAQGLAHLTKRNLASIVVCTRLPEKPSWESKR